MHMCGMFEDFNHPHFRDLADDRPGKLCVLALRYSIFNKMCARYV